jgi:hypothetical protein
MVRSHYISCFYCIHRIQVVSFPSAADTSVTPDNTADDDDAMSIKNMDYLLETCATIQDDLNKLRREVRNMQGGLRDWRKQCKDRQDRRRK